MTQKRKRSVTKRVSGPDDVQGEGAWAVVRMPTVEQMRDIRKRFKEASDDKDDAVTAQEDVAYGELKKRVLEWNWVDEDGEPMPQVPDDPSIIDKLLDAETAFLSRSIIGSEKSSKN